SRVKSLAEDMEFAVTIGNVEKGRAVRSPFIGPAHAFVERQPLHLIEFLRFRINLSEINCRRDIVPEKTQVLAVGRPFRRRLPGGDIGERNNIAASLAGALINTQGPNVGFDVGLHAAEKESAVATPDKAAADSFI